MRYSHVCLAFAAIIFLFPWQTSAMEPADGRGPFETKILVQVGEGLKSIAIQADQFFIRIAGGKRNPELLKAYFDRLAKGFIEMHRLKGITLVGLKKITFSKDLPADALVLSTPNERLLHLLRLRPTGGEVPQQTDGWVCCESEACRCSYCEPIEPIIVNP